jgi:hypothetical protein
MDPIVRRTRSPAECPCVSFSDLKRSAFDHGNAQLFAIPARAAQFDGEAIREICADQLNKP